MFKQWVDTQFIYEKGGGGGPMPVQETAADKANAQLLIDNNNRRLAQEEAAAKERADALAGRKEKKANRQSVQRGAVAANQFGIGKLNTSGINDTYGLLDTYNQRIEQDRLRGVEEGGGKAGDYINASATWDDVYNSTRTANRNKLNSTLNGYFGTGWDTNAINDTADDTYLNDIVNPQYEEANATLERARARGQLNDASYANATSALKRQDSAARAKAQTLGGGVLAGYRSKLGTDVDNLRTRVQNFDLGDNLNLENERAGINTKASGYLSGLAGDINTAVGGTEFYDINNLIGRALSAGGISNTNAATGGVSPTLSSAMASALSEDERRRQLGTVGAF